MTTYAIKIGNKYFKEYIYCTKENQNRYSGNTSFGSLIEEGDIVDIILTNIPERTEVKNSIGNTIHTLYSIEKLKDVEITIIPIKELII